MKTKEDNNTQTSAATQTTAANSQTAQTTTQEQTTAANTGANQQYINPTVTSAPLTTQRGVQNPVLRDKKYAGDYVSYDEYGTPISVLNGNHDAKVAFRKPVKGEAEREYERNNPNPELSEEEKKKQAKKERREKMIWAIGDGISSIANLVNTRNYAPDMFQGKAPGHVDKVNDRWEKLKAEAAANKKAYTEGLEKARQTDYNRWKDYMDMLYKQRQQDIYAKDKAETQQRNNMIAGIKAKLYESQTEGNHSRAAYYAAQIDALESGASADAALKAAKAAEAMARAKLANARTDKVNSDDDKYYTETTEEVQTTPSGLQTKKSSTTTRTPNKKKLDY